MGTPIPKLPPIAAISDVDAVYSNSMLDAEMLAAYRRKQLADKGVTNRFVLPAVTGDDQLKILCDMLLKIKKDGYIRQPLGETINPDYTLVFTRFVETGFIDQNGAVTEEYQQKIKAVNESGICLELIYHASERARHHQAVVITAEGIAHNDSLGGTLKESTQEKLKDFCKTFYGESVQFNDGKPGDSEVYLSLQKEVNHCGDWALAMWRYWEVNGVDKKLSESDRVEIEALKVARVDLVEAYEGHHGVRHIYIEAFEPNAHIKTLNVQAQIKFFRDGLEALNMAEPLSVRQVNDSNAYKVDFGNQITVERQQLVEESVIGCVGKAPSEEDALRYSARVLYAEMFQRKVNQHINDDNSGDTPEIKNHRALEAVKREGLSLTIRHLGTGSDKELQLDKETAERILQEVGFTSIHWGTSPAASPATHSRASSVDSNLSGVSGSSSLASSVDSPVPVAQSLELQEKADPTQIPASNTKFESFPPIKGQPSSLLGAALGAALTCAAAFFTRGGNKKSSSENQADSSPSQSRPSSTNSNG